MAREPSQRRWSSTAIDLLAPLCLRYKMECIADAGGGEVMGMQAFGERGVLAVCDGGAVTTWTHDNEDGAAFSSRHASRWALRPHAADEVIFEDGPVTRLAAVATDVLHDTFPLVAVASDSKPVEVASSAAAGIAFEYRSPAQLFSYKPEAVALGQPAFQAVASIPSLATAGVASPRARVSALALSASSQQLAVGDEHGCVSLWSLAEAAPRPAFACSLMGGFGPRVNGAALWLYGGQSLLLAWLVISITCTTYLQVIAGGNGNMRDKASAYFNTPLAWLG